MYALLRRTVWPEAREEAVKQLKAMGQPAVSLLLRICQCCHGPMDLGVRHWAAYCLELMQVWAHCGAPELKPHQSPCKGTHTCQVLHVCQHMLLSSGTETVARPVAACPPNAGIAGCGAEGRRTSCLQPNNNRRVLRPLLTRPHRQLPHTNTFPHFRMHTHFLAHFVAPLRCLAAPRSWRSWQWHSCTLQIHLHPSFLTLHQS